ncbi:MAG: hypothetical protein M3033_10585 [Acidobacteriota bacterium]|nr:hypothetical protein [Acidobacteriota bacterium]
MNKPKFIFSVAALFLGSLLFAANSFGQNQQQPSYEVVLNVLTASNTANDKSDSVPQSLATVVKKLKTTYSFSNYRLSSTYFQRVANTGNMEFKGVSNEPNQDVYAPIFSEWTLGQLVTLPDAKGQNAISIQSFRFGQRVPVKTSSSTDQSGKLNSIVNYEAVGLYLQKLNLPVNVPTIVGNLSTSKADELVFLILTVKPTEE